jgi:hypothetical protein
MTDAAPSKNEQLAGNTLSVDQSDAADRIFDKPETISVNVRMKNSFVLFM